MNKGINVVIVEDTEVIRESIAAIIRGTEGYNLIRVLSNGEDALLHIPSLNPDVVLMDIGLPGLSGIECIGQLIDKTPNTQYLVCSVFDDNDNVFQALKAGATGYMTKNVKPAVLLDAITDIYNGGSPMSPNIARKVISSMQKPKAREGIESLTPKESEILVLLSKGFRYKEIAEKQGITEGTVKTHINAIYKKLQVQSRTDALNKAFPR